jgi:hypothetical protein
MSDRDLVQLFGELQLCSTSLIVHRRIKLHRHVVIFMANLEGL